MNHSNIAEEDIKVDKVIIVSDGYGFDEKHKILQNLPKDITIIAVNGALKKWKLMSNKINQDDRRPINVYLVNNPYKECISYLPHKSMQYYPTCVASIRTYYEFPKNYYGNIYFYEPVPEQGFGFPKNEKYYLDDYRNPICASIGLAYRFEAKKLLLFCCDDSFEKEKDYTIKLDNELWAYPQQIKSQKITDANLYWFKSQEDEEIKVGDHSSGIKYKNAEYITEEDVLKFFEEEENKEESEDQ